MFLFLQKIRFSEKHLRPLIHRKYGHFQKTQMFPKHISIPLIIFPDVIGDDDLLSGEDITLVYKLATIKDYHLCKLATIKDYHQDTIHQEKVG